MDQKETESWPNDPPPFHTYAQYVMTFLPESKFPQSVKSKNTQWELIWQSKKKFADWL